MRNIDNRHLRDIKGSNMRETLILLLILGRRRFLASVNEDLSMQNCPSDFNDIETN